MFVLYPMMELIPVAWLQARITHASTKGITYLRCKSDSLAFFPSEVVDSAEAACSISRRSASACSLVRDRSSATRAASFLPRRYNQRGDSATIKLPITNKMPGGNDTQKILRQALSLNAKRRATSPSLVTSSHRMLKNMPTTAAATIPSVSSHWKIPVPLPRLEAERHSAR